MDRGELERLDRESLVSRAQAAGVRRARVLTRPELVDELLRLDPTVDERELKRTRGFFGRARDLLSKVVERGLHLPDAADRLRAALVAPAASTRPEPQAVPTVTLAEIYASQGHKVRAIETLRRVLEAEPDHRAALALLEKLEATDYVPPPPPLPPEGEEPSPEPPLSEDSIETEALPQVMAEPPPSDEAVTEALPDRGPIDLRQDAAGDGSSRRGAALGMSECVVARRSDPGVYAVSWRLSDRARRRLAGGEHPRPFVVRAVMILPTWDGPTVETRDLACDPSTGELLLRDCPSSALLRVAVGVGGQSPGERFVPIAHASPKR